jgi:hypothetical protein
MSEEKTHNLTAECDGQLVAHLRLNTRVVSVYEDSVVVEYQIGDSVKWNRMTITTK